MKKIAFKKLTKTDRFKLTIPKKSSFPQPPEGHHVKNFELRDESGVPWPVTVRTRRGKYKKPILSGGWHKLVLANHLAVHDEVSFFKEKDQATGRDKYMIKVETPIDRTISADALVNGTEEVTGKTSCMIEEKRPTTILGVTKDDAPVHGFDQVTGESDFKIDVKRETKMFDKATYRVEEKEATKLFGVTINDAPIHAFVQAIGEASYIVEANTHTPTQISEVTVNGASFYKWL